MWKESRKIYNPLGVLKYIHAYFNILTYISSIILSLGINKNKL